MAHLGVEQDAAHERASLGFDQPTIHRALNDPGARTQAIRS